MDIRIQKTETAIKNAFMELRSRKPVEKITVKELCGLAQINKSTFYTHYDDIYAALELGVKEMIYQKYPELRGDVEKSILLSFSIQGAYHAYLSHPEAEEERLASVIERISSTLRPLY